MPLTNRASTRSLPVSEVLLGRAALLNLWHPTKSHDLQVCMEQSLFFPATVQSSWWQWRQQSWRSAYFAATLCASNCVRPHQRTERRQVGQTTLPVIKVFIQGSKRFSACSCFWWKAALYRSRISWRTSLTQTRSMSQLKQETKLRIHHLRRATSNCFLISSM